MRKLSGSCASYALIAVSLLSVAACAKHEEPPLAAAVAPPPPPPPPPPSPPSADDQLQARLAQLGATSGNAGWTVTLSSASFRDGKVHFAADDEATITKVITLLHDQPNLRLQVEDYIDKRGPKARLHELSQMHANAVLRDLIAEGGDDSRIQAQGQVDTLGSSRVVIIFSNAEGEFQQPPAEHS